MLKKENRLRKTKEIEEVFKSKKSFYDDLLGFKFSRNETEINRYCIIISANISKKAVERNSLRRKIKSILIESKPSLKEGFDCLIIVKKEALKKDREIIKKSIEKAFKNNGLCIS
jgi:ribonuclease P protein component